MKKRAKKIVENTQSSISRGLGMSVLSEGGRYISDSLRSLFNLPKNEQKETFEQAVSRMHLTEDDLRKKIQRFWQQFWLFVVCGLFAFAYAISLFLGGSIGSGIVALLATLLFLAYAVRAHFWIFQMKNRKLGCTLQEWWHNKINLENDHKNTPTKTQ